MLEEETRRALGFLALACAFAFLLHPVEVSAASFWARAIGGASDDWLQVALPTADGGYLLAGNTYSYGAGKLDLALVKVNASGVISWQRTYGGSGDDYFRSVRQSSDWGYVIAGSSTSYGAGNADAWLMKITSAGEIEWQRTYGTGGADFLYSAEPLSGGGWIVAGETAAAGAESDAWLMKLDQNAAIVWQKKYGGTATDYLTFGVEVSGGGYLAIGQTSSFGRGSEDVWLISVDASGNVRWQRAYGGTGIDYCYTVHSTSSGSYILAGTTTSAGAGNNDGWLAKMSPAGDIVWAKTFGGVDDDNFYAVDVTADGGFVVAGSTRSFGAGDSDAWLVRLDSQARVRWQRTYGSSSHEDFRSVSRTSDGGLVAAGSTGGFGSGSMDAWILKLSGAGSLSSSCAFSGTSYLAQGDVDGQMSGTTAWNQTATAVAGTSSVTTPPYTTAADRLLCDSGDNCTLTCTATVSARAQIQTSVQFSATASTSGSCRNTTYVWDFGDGAGGTGKTATHSYASKGSYRWRLTATARGGGNCSSSGTIAIKALPDLVADVSVTSLSGGSVQVLFTCRNEGKATAAASKAQVYFSKTEEVDDSASQIGEVDVQRLTAGQSSKSYTVTGKKQSYFYAIVVVDSDDSINEFDEDDNTVAVALPAIADEPMLRGTD